MIVTWFWFGKNQVVRVVHGSTANSVPVPTRTPGAVTTPCRAVIGPGLVREIPRPFPLLRIYRQLRVAAAVVVLPKLIRRVILVFPPMIIHSVSILDTKQASSRHGCSPYGRSLCCQMILPRQKRFVFSKKHI